MERAKLKYKDLLGGEYNLTWWVVREKLSYDREVASFMMTAIGTVLSQKEASGYKITFVEGLGDDPHFIEAYLKGGEAASRKCRDPQKCLDMTLSRITITPEQSLAARLFQRITRIRKAYLEMRPMEVQDQTFLTDASSLPLYRYIEVSVAANSEFLMLDACEYMAHTLLLIQFENVAREILQALEQIASLQIDDHVIQKFQRNIQAMRQRLLILRGQNNSQAMTYLNTLIQGYEKVIVAKGLTEG